eukprot:gene2926-3646_t
MTTTTTTIRETVGSILNKASYSEANRSELLANAYEYLFYRDPSLLEEFYQNLIDFALDKSASIRKQIISYIESICKKFPIYIIKSKPMLKFIINDPSNASVVKRSMLCVVNLLRACFAYAIQFQSKEVWTSIEELKDSILSLNTQDDESSKSNTFKLLETLVLSFTSPGDTYISRKNKADDEFTIDKIPNDHPFVSKQQLQVESESYLSLLLESANDLSNMTSMNIMTLITTLSAIAKQRVSLLSVIMPVLCSCVEKFPKLSTVENESIKHSMKTCLLSILRLKNTAITPFVPNIIQALSQIESKEQAEEAARWYRGEPEKKKRQYQEQNQEGISKRIKHLDNNNNNSFNGNNNNDFNMMNVNAMSFNSPIFPQQIQQQQGNIAGFNEKFGFVLDPDTQQLVLSSISSLRPELIADLVIDNMSYAPVFQILQNIPYNQNTDPIYNFVNSYQLFQQQKLFYQQQQQQQQQPFNSFNSPNSFQSPPFFGQQPQQPSNMFQPNSFNQNINMQSPTNFPQQQFPNPNTLSPHLQPQQGTPPLLPVQPQHLLPDQTKPPVGKRDPRIKVSDSPPLDSSQQQQQQHLSPVFPPTTSLEPIDIKQEPIFESEEPEFEQEYENELELPPPPIKEEVSETSNQETSKLQDKSSEIVPSFTPKPAFRLPTISSELIEKIGLSSITRIKISELAAISGGKRELWTSLLSRLLAIRSEQKEEIRNEYVDFIVEDFTARREFALQWLHNELYASREKLIPEMMVESDRDETIQDRYTQLLLKMVNKMLSKFDHKDKALCTFILEVPKITKELLDLINRILNDHSGEFISLGLTTLRDLVIWRPTVRSQCLDYLLNYSVHKDDSIRSPTIRLITNQLYSKPSLTETIQEFSKSQVLWLIENDIDEIASNEENEATTTTTTNTDVSFTTNSNEEVEEEDINNKTINGSTKNTTDQDLNSNPTTTTTQLDQPTTTTTTTSTTPEEIKPDREMTIKKIVERKLLLYFSLCTKKPSLIGDLLNIYPRYKESIQQVIQRQISVVTKTIGQSNTTLLQVITLCPKGAEPFMIEILNSLVESDRPTPELVQAVKTLMKTSNDLRFLLPIVHGLDKEEIFSLLPSFINLPTEDSKNFIKMLSSPGSPVSPSELLVQLHLIETKDAKKPIEAINHCLEMSNIFKQEYMAVTIQQLMVQSPLPILLMRTILKTLKLYPRLKLFIVDILSQLVGKQVWNSEILWSGFLLCAKETKPESLDLILQLPSTQPCPCSNKTLCEPISLGPRKEFFGFVESLDNYNYYNYDILTTLSLFISTEIPPDDLLCKAHSHNIRLVLGMDFTPDLLENVTQMAIWAEQQAATVYNNFLDGINFDFEVSTNGEVSALYGALVAMTKQALNQYGPNYQVSVDVPYGPYCVWERCYDYYGFGQSSDLIVVMDYDMGGDAAYGQCVAAANSPLQFVTGGMYNYTLAQIPPEKLVMALPWYGYDYVCQGVKNLNTKVCPVQASSAIVNEVQYPDEKSSRKRRKSLTGCNNEESIKGLNYSIVMELLANSTITKSDIYWDSISASPFFNYMDSQKNIHQVWYDDPQSLEMKVRVAKKLNIGGVGMWTMDKIDYSNSTQVEEMFNALLTFFSK